MILKEAALRLLRDPSGEAAANMEKDLRIAEEVCAGQAPPTLRVYGWSHPAISLGRRQTLDDLPPELRSSERALVWRPTGGGAVVHDTDEFTYSLALSRPDFQGRFKPVDLPVWIHRQWKDCLEKEGLLPAGDLVCSGGGAASSALCFQAPVCGDLLYRNRKAAGSALRVWKGGLLIQGSVQGLPVPRRALAECLEAVCRRLLARES